MATREEKLHKIDKATLEIEQYLKKEGFNDNESYVVILTLMQRIAQKVMVTLVT